MVKEKKRHLKAGGPVEELHHVSYAGFWGLRKTWFESLNHEQNQNLPWEGRTIFQSEKNQLQCFFLHGFWTTTNFQLVPTYDFTGLLSRYDGQILPGPRNWQPLALTAAHRFEESCWGFWCWRMSSVTVRSPRERAARMARMRPSSSTSWQCTRVTSFRCMGLLSTLWAVPFSPAPARTETNKNKR